MTELSLGPAATGEATAACGLPPSSAPVPAPAPLPLVQQEHPELAPLLDTVQDWAAFDVFRLATASGGRPLQLVTSHLLSLRGLVDRLHLSRPRLASFLAAVEGRYGAQPYHNSTHAADVTQALGAMMAIDAWAAQLRDWEALAVVVAAAVHDLGHPGVNNEFHKRTQSDHARRFGAGAGGINEHGHAALALHLLSLPEHDFLLGAADPREAADFRDLLQELILCTDMAQHGEVLAAFSRELLARGPQLGEWPPSARRAALHMLLHCADISNPARPLHHCAVWGERVQAELFAQGDRERALGLEVTPACNREHSSPQRSQAAFIRHVIRPSFQVLAPLAPRFTALVTPFVDSSLEHWLRESGRKGGGSGGEEGCAPRDRSPEEVLKYLVP